MKNKQFKAVFFDVDGTLLNTTEFLFQAYEYTLKKHKLPKSTRNQISKLMGRDIREIYANLAPDFDSKILIQTHTDFQLKNTQLAKPFPKTIQTLVKLRKAGIKIAAITNRFNTARKTLEETGTDEFMDLVIAGDDVENLKPHPEGLLKALTHFEILSSEAVMIGDSPPDILAGKNANVATIAVTYGFLGKDIAKTEPDYLVDDIADILPLIMI